MINSVRNTVLSILNKNNYGYISPSDFNLFAKQAQLELFDGYFTDYNKIVTLENARRSHSGYADMGKQAVEVIEEFSTFTLPAYTSGNFFVLPSDFYYITAVRYNPGSGTPVDAEYVKQEQ